MNRQTLQKFDFWFLFPVLALIFFGVVMISSSSVVISAEHFGHNYGYVLKQLSSLAIGLVVMFVFSNIHYNFWRKNATLFLVITIISLILVFVPGVGKEAGGASRWFDFGPLRFQPSEFVKLTFLIYLAAFMEKTSEKVEDFWGGFVPFASFLAIIGFLIMAQPDLGTMSIITIMAVTVYFVAGANLKHLGVLLASLLTLLIVLIKAAPYRMQRFLVFLNPENDTRGASYHINQALMAIGSGGLWGKGFGRSQQKYLYLPQPHTDSIYAIIAEELGFLRSSIVLILFLFLGYRGFKIAKFAPDMFSRLLAAGITVWILSQALINIAAMLSLVPLTGVPMPFVSYGGSSLIVLMGAIGIMLNISKYRSERI